MPHKTRFERFEKYFDRYNIQDKLVTKRAEERETPGRKFHSIKIEVQRFAITPACIDFFNKGNSDLWLPGITDAAEYIHKLNESETIRVAREHALKCGRCMISLDAFLLSQVDLNLFQSIFKNILGFEIHQDNSKNIYIAGLPWPGHQASTKTGRLVYVTKLPIKNGVWELHGRVIERLRSRGVNIQLSDFDYTIKQEEQDGEDKAKKRDPCYQATARLPEKKGYVCIRSKANSKPVENN